MKENCKNPVEMFDRMLHNGDIEVREGIIVDEYNDEMNTLEMSLASEWLRAHGHSDDEVIDFIHYIAQGAGEAEKAEA